MGLLKHFTLAASAGPLVHDGDDVVVWGDDLDGRTMVCHPALAFAQPNQHTVNPFLGARTGIEIVRKQFVQRVAAIMDNNLFLFEMRVPEYWGNVNDGSRAKAGGNTILRVDPF